MLSDPFGALDDNGGVGESGHDAVSLHKVHLLYLGMTHKLRQQSSLLQHIYGCLAMQAGVYFIEAVGEHTHRRQMIGQRCTMSCDVDSVGQAADHECIGQQPREVSSKAVAEVAPTLGAATGADDTDDMFSIEVCGAQLIED